MSYYEHELQEAKELPKSGKRLTHYSFIRLISVSDDFKLPPLEIELGDLFKIYFGTGTAGFLVNQIYKDTRNNILVKGCRLHRINEAPEKQWFASNTLLVEVPRLNWEPLRFTPSYTLMNFKEGLTSETVDYLQGKL